jgi:hypothetical protein
MLLVQKDQRWAVWETIVSIVLLLLIIFAQVSSKETGAGTMTTTATVDIVRLPPVCFPRLFPTAIGD